MNEFNLNAALSAARSFFVSCRESQSVREYEHIVSEYFEKLITNGYRREQLYKIANSLTESKESDLPVDLTDAIRNYETGLTGYCARSAIIRVPNDPNEPSDPDELVTYVRNMQWTQDPSIKPVN